MNIFILFRITIKNSYVQKKNILTRLFAEQETRSNRRKEVKTWVDNGDVGKGQSSWHKLCKLFLPLGMQHTSIFFCF